MMHRKTKEAGQLNNKGLSLVELLVAMVILSIITSIILHAFLTSARINRNSRIQHKATTLAQDILESVKASDVDGLSAQFQPDAGGNYDFHLLSKEILSTPDGSEDVGIFADGEHKNRYYLKNLSMDGLKFDALITLDANAYLTGGSSGKEYNDAEYTAIPTMDSDFDAVIADTISYDAQAKALADAASKVLSERTITVTVTKALYPDGYGEKVSYKYEYKCGTETIWSSPNLLAYTNEEDRTKQLSSVYVFFPPKYEWKENIIINNEDDAEFELYLVKQQMSTDPADLIKDDASYTVNVQVIQNTLTTKPTIQICTNLGYALYDGSQIPGSNQASYKLGNSQVINPDKPNSEGGFALNNLVGSNSADKLFDVTVDVYLHGSDDAPASYDDFLTQVGDRKATLTSTVTN